MKLLEGMRMGCPAREEVEEFFAYVLEKTGLKTELKWSKAEPSICMEHAIYLRESLLTGYRWDAAEEVLHELSHIAVNGAEDKLLMGHGADFYRRFVGLSMEFLTVDAGSFRCPDCGPDVKADEDGCCAACGADCEIMEPVSQ